MTNFLNLLAAANSSLSSSHTILSRHGEPFKWQMLRLIWGCFQSKGSLLNYHNEDCMRAAKIMLQMSGYFPFCSLRHRFALPIFPSQNGLKQPWLLRRSMKELLAQKSFCWPSRGQPEHGLERGVSSAMAGGTASPTHCSLKSKQRGFCCPRQLLPVWKHLVLLALPSLASPQTAEVSQSSEFRWRPGASACFSLYQPQPSTNHPLEKNRKYFLADSVEYGSWLNTSKTWSGKDEEMASTSVRNLGSIARLSSSQLLCCSDQELGPAIRRGLEFFSWHFSIPIFHS